MTIRAAADLQGLEFACYIIYQSFSIIIIILLTHLI